MDMARGSLSTSFMTRNQDISFGTGSPAICDAQSPEVTYRSSFSSLLMDPSTPCFTSGGFSFRSSGGSNTLEFSTPVAAMPSFAFFRPGSEAEQGNYASDFSANITRVDSIRQGTNGSRMSGIHSRRNHTIGLGEFDQIDLMVTESVIRWASCTQLPTATSLRSSLNQNAHFEFSKLDEFS
ncbi:unnamed protein product [Camellia sinensis]